MGVSTQKLITDLKSGIEMLEKQGPSNKVIEHFENSLKNLKLNSKSQNSNSEKLITGNDPEVKKFKEERSKKREENRKEIEKKLSEVYDEKNVERHMKELYPYNKENKDVPAKKYRSKLYDASMSLEEQKKALNEELNKKGVLWSEVNRLYTEGANLKKCEELIEEIETISKDEPRLAKGIKLLNEGFGANDKMVKYFEDLLKDLKSNQKQNQKSTSNSKSSSSRYAPSLAQVILRKAPHLKYGLSDSDFAKLVKEIASYISENESKFKSKFQNSLKFDMKIGQKLSELEKCNDVESLKKFLDKLI